METQNLHSWNLSYARAREVQAELACKVKFTPLKKSPKLLAGIDCAFSRDGERIFAVVVLLRLPQFELVETVSASRKVTFPYIPGLLSFREAPVCLAAVEKLQNQPEVFIIDGQGIAHPRRLGLAAHLGLFLDQPTIGCAKSRLTGTYEEPPIEKGAYCLLKDEKGKQNTQSETIGAVVRTRTNVKPVFVSVGHKCLLKDAVRVVLDCAVKYRLPEPTRLAHQAVSKLKLKA
ncbi:MAG TPA: deoxyribonuclease V [Sedimentisphaerales bacterium]|nr:deoxyribonuclease V [Sedimentisphaerales bacterium]